jgi:hypothetical protein
VRARDERLAESINEALAAYESVVGPLPGIDSPEHRGSFVRQLVDSVRRNLYVMHIVDADLSPLRGDPTSGKFDPLKAAVLFNRSTEYDEAFWMLFRFVYFGRHRVARWRYAANVYGRVGDEGRWDWASVSSDIGGFRAWLDANAAIVKGVRPHGFGNHRKYESLSGWSDAGTGAVVASYLDWVGPGCTHLPTFEAARRSAGDDASAAYDTLFKSMTSVRRFGRTARFDYLSMAGKLGLADIKPGRAYLLGSTGPVRGAKLLFDPPAGASSSAQVLDDRLIRLNEYLGVGFDVLEDALCNWQKSPGIFRPFRG